jgi:signal transduction histidine kinase
MSGSGAALNRVVDDGHRAGQLIGDIRAMYRKDDQQRISLDVNELIREMVALLRDQLRHHEVAVQSELMPELPKVLGNRIQLQQVILNLMMNAAEAMDAVRDRPRMLRLKTELHGSNGVLITVEDSGPGIDPKNIERVFNPLFTTKSGGMGMGLSICRSIVEAHDGRLWASSGNPYGSIFHVLLPTS